MNDALKLTIIAIGFSLVFTIITKILTTKLEKQLVSLIINKDYDGFDKLIDSIKTKYLLRPFNIDFMKLNVALLKLDIDQIDAMFNYFEEVRLNKTQKEAVSIKGFYYYLSIENYGKVKKYYNYIKQLKNDESSYEFDRIYDVYVKNGCEYLQETLKELETANELVKPVLEAMISKMYENKNEDKLAQEYADKAKKHLKNQ